MKAFRSVLLLLVAAAVGSGAGALAGRWWTLRSAEPATPDAPPGDAAGARREVLYWYDPMYPQQRFERPGKSPFMDMELVPRYADEGVDPAAGQGGVKIDPVLTQNLGMRLATVERVSLVAHVDASGIVGLNGRAVAVVQSRAAGFVERVWPLAPGDVIAAGQALAQLRVPAWTAAQHEFIAVRGADDAALLAAARERLLSLGMTLAEVRALERGDAVQARHTVRAPIGGVLESLDVRAGMTLAAGQTLARINGLDPVWLEVAVPEAQARQVTVGARAEAHLAAAPGETVVGRVTALLPTLNDATRSLRVRVELPNADGRLRPGQSAQVRLLGDDADTALAVPTEAVIRTGRRALVMVAGDGGRYRSQEVTLGPELGDKTVIRAGLDEGQQVVASGQFLVDSEASLLGIGVGPAADRPVAAPHSGHVQGDGAGAAP
ncbi:efflux RND transporter periplasmic adaptor subunit [Immundisolibacter sp.]|uniref:efflux RND transporter periplasmic adaptor subunit n=1 Tax=Immundisolibacter sp. TaxID=1934948 RepID=UPI002B11AA1D|nr:efflux RND transporter periplasmic adaptor subunit [Immundisolibacter sp.]MEA3221165.1 Cation efflux system protein CusB [Immundisolibacter sp.]